MTSTWTKIGWKCWVVERKLLAAAAAAGVLVAVLVVWLSWSWLGSPDSAAQLFRKRCTSCHELPDLSGYRRQDISGIVETMMSTNGADKVITPEEARRITTFLEQAARP